MKRLMPIIALMFLSACSTANYNLEIQSNVDNNFRHKPIELKTLNNNVWGERAKQSFAEVLEINGWKVISQPLKSDYYVGTIEYKQDYWQTTASMPRYGNQRINSINTTSYGNNSVSNINYDYGIVGYDNVAQDNYRTCINFNIYQAKGSTRGTPVLNSQLCTNQNIKDNEILLFAESAYRNYLGFGDININLDCQSSSNFSANCSVPK